METLHPRRMQQVGIQSADAGKCDNTDHYGHEDGAKRFGCIC